MFLDEATSALDHIDRQGTQSKSGMIVVSIAHRLSTFRGCVTINVLSSALVIVSRTHRVLIGKEGFLLGARVHAGGGRNRGCHKGASEEDARHISKRTAASVYNKGTK